MVEKEKIVPPLNIKLTKGHRHRLREKFLKSGLSGFHDYEIVELLLTLGTPRKDCKAIAKACLEKFKNLRGVLDAPYEELQEIKGIGQSNAYGIKLIKETASRYFKDEVLEMPQFRSSEDVFNYLLYSMQGLKKELFKVLYLDSRNKIVFIEDIFEGTLNASAVYPREIFRSAFKNNAVSLIFAHNHPSGVPEPSLSDREVTKSLVFMGVIMEIKVLDHLIIGNNSYFSFADEGLIGEYEALYSTIKTSVE